jgi:hypothetical protein
VGDAGSSATNAALLGMSGARVAASERGAGSGSGAAAGSGGGGHRLGKVKVFGPNPGQAGLPPRALRAGVAGMVGLLSADNGSNRSMYSVDGDISEHWSGRATDIPLRGRALMRAGQAALIRAGMPAEQAHRQHGGLFNVVDRQGTRWQIIFNAQDGGDHSDHLHVGRKAPG